MDRDINVAPAERAHYFLISDMEILPGTYKNVLDDRASSKHAAVVWMVAVFIAGLSLVAHITSNSTLHQSEDMWQKKLILHQTSDNFRIRPLTTSIVAALHDHAGVPLRTGFMILQFTLYLLCGPVFWFFLRTIGFSEAYALAGMIIYLLTLPLFMAHFEPIHTWSDFWVYLLVPLSLALAVRRRYTASLMSMVIALMARETTLLFLPAWFLFIYVERGRKYQLAIGLTLAAALLFIAVRMWLTGRITVSPENGPGFNFESFLRGSDTIFSLVVSLGFVWVVGLWQAFRNSQRPPRFYSILRFGALFTAAGFVSSTLLMARARETRLFVPPVIFLLPLVLVYVRDRRPVIKRLLQRIPSWAIAVSGAALLSLCIWIAKLAFPEFEYRLWRDGNWTYLGLHLALIVVFVLIELSGRRQDVAVQQGKY